ncbi:uncharacterized protein TNCV_1183361 [Trichonephila clavipes]|nr:uncharacterized protein TNCV_1183361 [Trichonephila clavipes]
MEQKKGGDIYREIAKSSFKRIKRKHIFGDGSKDVKLSYEDDLRRTVFSSIDRVTAEIRERFQHLQNLGQKYAFLRPEVILSMDEINLDQAPEVINKEEFQLEHIRLQAFVTATDPGCKKELISLRHILNNIVGEEPRKSEARSNEKDATPELASPHRAFMPCQREDFEPWAI